MAPATSSGRGARHSRCGAVHRAPQARFRRPQSAAEGPRRPWSGPDPRSLMAKRGAQGGGGAELRRACECWHSRGELARGG
jgi:hypothetical protein